MNRLIKNTTPISERMRPKRLEEMVGQKHILGSGCFLHRNLQAGRIFSVILWGPPGSGKTTLARLMGEYARLPFRAFSAVTSGLKELRKILEEAGMVRATSGRQTILFVDEIHRFNKAQQDAFLPHLESGLIILIGATTQNPSFEVIPPLLSRVRVMTLHALSKKDVKDILVRALNDKDHGLGMLDIKIEQDSLGLIADLSHGDGRVALNNLEAAVYHALDTQDQSPLRVGLETVQNSNSGKVLSYDKDGEEHYNIISAFHKSMRGSDVQASIYWLYRMLMAGEDPLFIGRRMIRFATEDIGMADPNALGIALAAFESWQKVGPPEAELALAQATVYLASAPKSNALYLAEKAVKKEIERSGPKPVPLHIRNAPTSLMKKQGYGRGYLYPHNYPNGWVYQEYLPEGIEDRVFYRPTNRGVEQEIRTKIRDTKMNKGTGRK